MKRLRQEGQIPAVLYGSGENMLLQIPLTELNKVMQAGTREVQLLGDLSEQVRIQSVQWDSFGTEVMHVDLTRVG